MQEILKRNIHQLDVYNSKLMSKKEMRQTCCTLHAVPIHPPSDNQCPFQRDSLESPMNYVSSGRWTCRSLRGRSLRTASDWCSSGWWRQWVWDRWQIFRGPCVGGIRQPGGTWAAVILYFRWGCSRRWGWKVRPATDSARRWFGCKASDSELHSCNLLTIWNLIEIKHW